jgi:hypothetical protein
MAVDTTTLLLPEGLGRMVFDWTITMLAEAVEVRMPVVRVRRVRNFIVERMEACKLENGYGYRWGISVKGNSIAAGSTASTGD